MDALLGRTTLDGLATNGDEDELGRQRLELGLRYGFLTYGGKLTAVPEIGLTLSDTSREENIGWRFIPSGPNRNKIELRLEATRRESTESNTDPLHGIGVGLAIRF